MLRRRKNVLLAFNAVLMLVVMAGCGAPKAKADPQLREVAGGEYYFKPDELRITAGEPVRLVFKNEGALGHDWAVPELDNVDTKVIYGGEEVTIEFTINQPGEYEFICTVPGHRELGMVGTLVVTNP